MGAPPTPQAEVDVRVGRVAEMLADGLSRREVVSICENEYGVSRATADRYLRAARGRVAETFDASLEYRAAVVQGRLERLYAAAVDNSDIRSANAVLKSLMALWGLSRGVEPKDDDEGGPRMRYRLYCQSAARFSMAQWANAIAETLDPNQIAELRARAFRAGAEFDLGDLIDEALARNERDRRAQELLDLVPVDVERYGRARTREELVAAGLIGPGDGDGYADPGVFEGLPPLA